MSQSAWSLHGPGAVATVRGVFALARDRNLTYLAAAIAYYAFVSIFPLVLLAVAVASFLGGEQLGERVTALASQQLSESGQNAVAGTLTETTGRGIASVVSLLALTWSGLKLFRGLDQAFDEVYTDDVATSLPEQLRDGLVVISGIGLIVGLVVAASVAVATLPLAVPYLDVVGAVGLVAVLTLAFLPIYYVLPPIDVSVREILPGAAVAAVGWVLLQVGFRLYAANAGRAAAYGMIGGVLLFVTWLYFASIVVLLGAAVNAVRRGVTAGTLSSAA